MLDSGALAHMAGEVSLMKNLEKISPIAIGLPNGACTMAHEKGSVALGDHIELDNVLYVPNLSYNHVYISKLCKLLNCGVTYFDDFCVI